MNLKDHRKINSAISNYLFEEYQLIADQSCSNPSRAFFLTFDEHFYLNQEVLPFDCYEQYLPKEKPTKESDDVEIDDPKIQQYLKEIEERKIDITDSYQKWLRVGFFCSNYGESGRTLFHRLSQFHPEYSVKESDKQFDACLKNNGGKISIGTFIKLCKDNGIEFSETNTETDKPDLLGKLSETPFFPSSVYENLPDNIKEITGLMTNDRERDVFLLSLILCASSIMNRICGFYYPDMVFANLFGLILAPPASDKGIARKTTELLDEIIDYLNSLNKSAIEIWTENDEEGPKPTLRLVKFPGNTTTAALMATLKNNPGGGLFSETEADTLSAMFRQDYGDFSNILRKAFHHEPVSSIRKKDNEYIYVSKPRLSVLLTGTPGQLLGLINSTEDGLFSRFIFYLYAQESTFRDPFKNTGIELNEKIKSLGDLFYEIWSDWSSLSGDLNEIVEFQLTISQQQRMNAAFKEWDAHSVQGFDQVSKSTIRRLGLVFFRVCMILTILRDYQRRSPVICTDIDFDIAMGIVNTIRIHSLKALEMMPENEPVKIHEKSKQGLFDQLPGSFRKKEAIQVAETIGISKRSVHRYCAEWVKAGLLRKVENKFIKNNT